MQRKKRCRKPGTYTLRVLVVLCASPMMTSWGEMGEQRGMYGAGEAEAAR